ncbi:MAG TPA: hypothetical protein VK969_10670 [Acidimicrobiia bacterium]|nr:hypothetical protein [Acidimicrobiia bacterium]
MIAALVVIGLAVGVVLAWPTGIEDPPDTLADATTTTSTSVPPDPTTTSEANNITTMVDDETSHVVETVDEAEEILRELWFGWFEGIYNEDEDRIREVVILEETVDQAKKTFGTEFERAPELEDISFNGTEILRSDAQCLVLETELVTTGFSEGSSRAVEIMRWTADGWKSLSTWTDRGDLWEADCESSLSS